MIIGSGKGIAFFDGSVSIISIDPVANPERVLGQLVDIVPKLYPNFFSLNDRQETLHLALGGEVDFTWIWQTPIISIHTHFRIEKGRGAAPRYVPTFGREYAETDLRMMRRFILPHGIFQLICVTTNINYHFMYIKEGVTLRLFPLSNIATNGKICMGEETAEARDEDAPKGGQLSRAFWALNSFKNSIFTPDWLDDWKESAARKMFTFPIDFPADEAFPISLPVPEFLTLTKAVNNPEFHFLVGRL